MAAASVAALAAVVAATRAPYHHLAALTPTEQYVVLGVVTVAVAILIGVLVSILRMRL